MNYRYKHSGSPEVLIIDADTPDNAKTILLRVVKSHELWSKDKRR
jgi:hypothetical protein